MKRKIQKPIPVEYEVNAWTFNPPMLLDDFMPSIVTAEFNFIEHDQLTPLLTQIYEMDSDANVKVIEHSAPGRNRLIFEGGVAHCLLALHQETRP